MHCDCLRVPCTERCLSRILPVVGRNIFVQHYCGPCCVCLWRKCVAARESRFGIASLVVGSCRFWAFHARCKIAETRRPLCGRIDTATTQSCSKYSTIKHPLVLVPNQVTANADTVPRLHSLTQVENWFINIRMREWRPAMRRALDHAEVCLLQHQPAVFEWC